MDTTYPVAAITGTELTPDQEAAFYVPIGALSLADLANAGDDPKAKRLYSIFAPDTRITLSDAKTVVKKRAPVSLWSHVKIHRTSFTTEREDLMNKLIKRVLGGSSTLYTMQPGGLYANGEPNPFYPEQTEEPNTNFVSPPAALLLYKPTVGHQIGAPPTIVCEPSPPAIVCEPSLPTIVCEPPPRLAETFFSALVPVVALPPPTPRPMPVGPAVVSSTEPRKVVFMTRKKNPKPLKKKRSEKLEPTKPVNTFEEFKRRRTIGEQKEVSMGHAARVREFQRRRAAAEAHDEVKRLMKTEMEEERLVQIAAVIAQRTRMRLSAGGGALKNMGDYWGSPK